MHREIEKSELDPQRKVSIDDPSNFQFHAAYLAYSEAFDRVSDLKVKEELNQNIIALKQNKIDYQTFYKNINRYRNVDSPHYRHGMNIKTQSKTEWRSQMRKMEREKRYER